jgi:hypothetical protein
MIKINKLISINYNNISTALIYIFCAIILIFSLRGIAGNPTEVQLDSTKWKDNGPFELSPERGRFALTYSLVEYNSLQFSDQIGKFATPDVGINKSGKYVSLFAPLLSFIVIPGYLIGSILGISQVGTFTVISLFALLNFALIRLISLKLGANKLSATLAAIIFLFATPAYSYAVNLYQHHISTFLILLSIYILLKSSKTISFMLIFFLCALAVPLDYPNLFFMAPIGIVSFIKIFNINNSENVIKIKINISKFLAIFIMIIPIVFFLLFNYYSYGNPFQLSGTVTNVKSLQYNGITDANKTISSTQLESLAAPQKTKSPLAFFQTRNILNGFYLHFISPDRGIIYFTPIMFLGFLGIILSLKNKVKLTPLLVAILGAIILLYEMWGDPWGGWAFGSRYLIPGYAILSIFIAHLLTYWGRKIIILIITLPLIIYSLAVNTLGAITTSAMPPQVEVLNLEKISGAVQKYTYQRNWDLLLSGQSKSFIFQTFLKDLMNPVQFYWILIYSLVLITTIFLVLNYYMLRKEKYAKN